jgi:DNA topoisomerase-2
MKKHVENKKHTIPYNMPPKTIKETKETKETVQLSLQYQQKTDKQHILDNPDTYIGSVETIDADIYVFDEGSQSIVQKNIQYNPGLYKLFDEGIVNARDHVVRMIQSADESKKNVTFIETTVGEDGTITITNDGNGIDVAKHPENNLWIPEMVFGHLRTSTNYNKDEKKIVGGKNGFGFKLVLIWSTYGRIETVDHVRGLKYVQEFKSNLDEICEPVITKCKSAKPYTTVTFRPDYQRLGSGTTLTSDMLALIKKRVYDIAAVTDHSAKKIKVIYNGAQVPIKNFQQYIDTYLASNKKVYEEASERWEYAVALSPTHEFQQVSFVNGICTFKGGKHVEYITGQITRKIAEYIEKKKKVKVAPSSIKEQIIVFVRCDIENPAFDSQTKDCMNTPVGKFGSSCTVSDAFIEKVAKMGVMDMACSLTEAKETKQAKKTDGAKTKTVRGIANFMDANWSGGPQSKDCILILCEGLSAMSGIVSGLSREDRNMIGIYPLKGKVLNVRGEMQKKISENKEITDVKKILGLETGRKYKTAEDLRYGKVMIMTDQDLDGSHIKGLCINLFHSEWGSLTEIPGFISFMNTPILRAKKGAQTLLFYNEGEYARWKTTASDGRDPNSKSAASDGRDPNSKTAASDGTGWTVKYFKGLGTSTSAEFKEYFANKKIVDFVTAEKTGDTIDMVFNKKRPDDRKLWLEKYDKSAYLDTSHTNVSYEEFIDKEMIHFSKYDCERSIPNMVDGLKTSQRKILFAAFKRRLTHEIKVAQFSGYVSEHSAYHHGEASLNGAIVNMAQTFVGSNNINLLEPNGQFGTRLQGGDDSASERYIFTQLNKISRIIFPETDDAVLKNVNDDGLMVEPEYYVPILPFVLLNGISGIGTGFSSTIPSYDPLQIIEYLKQTLTTSKCSAKSFDFVPYYEGFTGTITPIEAEPYKFLIKGRYEQIAEDKIQITELPIGTWTMPYTLFLESLLEPTIKEAKSTKEKEGKEGKEGKKTAAILKDMVSMCTETKVDFVLTFPKGELSKWLKTKEKDGINGVEKLLKLTTTVSTRNMHLFDAECKLHKYDTVEEIIDDFAKVRLATYSERKKAQIQAMESLLQKLSNRARYIQYILTDKIDLRRKTAQQISDLLETHGFDKLAEDGNHSSSYKYLVKMPMDSVSQENVEKIMQEKAETEEQLRILKATSEQQMWLNEITLLEKEYMVYKKKRENIQIATSDDSSQKKKSSKKK